LVATVNLAKNHPGQIEASHQNNFELQTRNSGVAVSTMQRRQLKKRSKNTLMLTLPLDKIRASDFV